VKFAEQAVDLGGLNGRVGYQARRVNARSLQLWDRVMSELAMPFGHYSVLTFITLNPTLIQKEIAAIAGVDQTTIVPIINHLQKSGLVERTRDPRDGRNIVVRTTDQGRALLKRVDDLVEAHERELVRGLSTAEAATLLGLLSRVSGLPA
jgi:DNA-binding MarR family transcriptional regulator